MSLRVSNRAYWLILAFLLVALVGAACAEAQPTPAAAPANATAAPAAAKPTAAPAAAKAGPTLDQMYELAKKEGGNLYWNIGAPADEYDKVISAFKKRFPDIKLETGEAEAPTLASRIVTEAAAGKVSVDIGTGSLGGAMPVIDRDLLEKVDFSGIDVANPKDILLDGRAVKVLDQPWVIFYNTKYVTAADAPKTWEDLLDPKWKGRVTISRIPVNLAALPVAWGEQKATEYVQALAKTGVVRGSSSEDVVDRVQRGEQWFGISDVQNILDMAKDGAPLAIAPISPQYVLGDQAFLYKGAPHVNAGKLFMAWLATPEAKDAYKAQGYAPFISCSASEAAKALCDLKIDLVYEDSIERAKASAQVRTDYAKILGFTAQ